MNAPEDRVGPLWRGTPEEAEAWERQRRIAEHIASRPPREPLNDRYDWERVDRSPEHPGGTGMRRVRPKSVLAQIPRSMRIAEIVCTAKAGQPRVVAIIYPRGLPVDQADVETEHGHFSVGTNGLVWCRCGLQHFVDGGQLRAELLALRVSSGRVPQLDIRRVDVDPSRPDGNTMDP